MFNNSLIVRKLVLVGSRKNYALAFSEGVNVIYGDSATGKSSVLEFINYLLGSSKLIFDREIEASVQYAMMHVELAGRPYVIKRDIFEQTTQVEVYSCTLEELDENFPKKYSPSYEKEGEDGYFSDFLLSALGFPAIKMRQAPTKDDSPMVRLSFRDIFKFCYLKQDDVGSKALLGDGGYAAVKNKETFKYIYQLLDANITELQSELAIARSRARELQAKYRVVSDFLRSIQFETESDIDDKKILLAQRKGVVNIEMERISSAVTASNETYASLRLALRMIVNEIKVVEQSVKEANDSIERYSRLKNDYQLDIKKLKSVESARSLIGAPRHGFSCPLCDSHVEIEEVKQSFGIGVNDRVSHEVNSLARRIKELDNLIDDARSASKTLMHQLNGLYADRDKARKILDDEVKEAISPYLAERDMWRSELTQLEAHEKKLEDAIKIRNQQKSIFADWLAAQHYEQNVEERLEVLKKNAPILDEVLSELGDYLFGYLREVGIGDLREVSISHRNFLPVLRGRDYRDVTSGGLRTILSIGFYLSLLESSLAREMFYPRFLMVDTVGKYLGKTQQKYANDTDLQEDRREGVSDPRKFAHMYAAMLSVSKKASEKSVAMQIIIVDNDVPDGFSRQFPDKIVSHFEMNGYRKGLIDDAHLI